MSIGVRINPSLPVIESEADAKLRTPEDVAKRVIILNAVVHSAHGLDRQDVSAWLKSENIWDSVSPQERQFLEGSNPTEQDRINATWRAESVWTLLWALGKIETLELPTKECDIDFIQTLMLSPGTSCAEFIKQSKLRSVAEILDATDLIYRIHWVVRDAQLNNQEIPGSFVPGIAYERHYALNWLVGYSDQEWDEITTDT